MKTETRGWLHLSNDLILFFSFFVTRAVCVPYTTYEEVKNSADREREREVSTLSTIHSISSDKQASTFSTHT